MAGTNTLPHHRRRQLTVALDLPSAQLLADQISTIQDLQFVMECCKRLLTELVNPRTSGTRWCRRRCGRPR